MSKRKHPTKKQLRSEFKYRNGFLYRKTNPNKKVGVKGNQNYARISCFGSCFQAHRLIWIYHNGDIPEGMVVDHIDKDRANNKLKNLRLLTYQQNNLHTSKVKPNSSGYSCVTQPRNSLKWQVQMSISGNMEIHLFNEKMDAVKFAYEEILNRRKQGIITPFFATEKHKERFLRRFPEYLEVQ